MQWREVETKDLPLPLKGMPLMTFKMIELIFQRLPSLCSCNRDKCKAKECLDESWDKFSRLLLAVYGAQLSNKKELTLTVSNVDVIVRPDVVTIVRMLSGAVIYTKLDWDPLASKTDTWTKKMTIRTRLLSVLHDDQRHCVMTTLLCWRFRGESALSSLPFEVLAKILVMLSQPPYFFCKRCTCCNALVSGETFCIGCIEPVYFCNTDCQKKALPFHFETCNHVSQRKKRAKTMKLKEPLPPFMNKRDSSYAKMIQMRFPNESQFISCSIANASKTQ